MSEVCYPNLTLTIEPNFEVDANGVCYIVTEVFVGDDDEGVSARTQLEDTLESLLDYYADIHGYKNLYCIAHELSRFAEILRERASRIEDSTEAVADLFNLSSD